MSHDIDAVIASLSHQFHAAADPERATAMAAYMRDQFLYFGVPAPLHRQIARAVRPLVVRPTEPQLVELVTKLWTLPPREFQYYALDEIQRHTKKCSAEFLVTIESLITTRSCEAK